MNLKDEKSKVTKKLASKKLEDLGVIEKEQDVVLGGTNEKVISNPTPSLFQYTQSRSKKSGTRKGTSAYTPTSREEYRKSFPSVKTPSTFSRDKVDETLRSVADKFVLIHGSSDVSISEESRTLLIQTLYRYFGDVLEGMDCIILSKNKETIVEMFTKIVTEFCVHQDEQGVNRFIKCEPSGYGKALELPTFLDRRLK